MCLHVFVGTAPLVCVFVSCAWLSVLLVVRISAVQAAANAAIVVGGSGREEVRLQLVSAGLATFTTADRRC